MVNGGIEIWNDRFDVAALPQEPHEFCHGGFSSHVVTLQNSAPFGQIAHGIALHAGAFHHGLACTH